MPRFACPTCKSVADWPADRVGVVRCQQCGQGLQLPGSAHGIVAATPPDYRDSPPRASKLEASACPRGQYQVHDAKEREVTDVPRAEPIAAVRCPSCNRAFKVRDELMGKTVHCPACATAFAMPSPVQVRPDVDPPERRAATATGFARDEAASRPDTIATVCPSCGARGQLPSGYLDRRVRCSGCQEEFVPNAPAPTRRTAFVEEVEHTRPRNLPSQAQRITQYDGPTVQCYDCRYVVPVDDSMSMLANTGHSTGSFSGTGTGVSASWGGGLGVGAGGFRGSSSSEHFGKVDFCVPCCEKRLTELKTRLKGYQALALVLFTPAFLVPLLISIANGGGFIGFVVALTIGSVVGGAAASPIMPIQNQIASASRNGRWRRPI
jgi:ssDNA-binding Zn-finger/Zn-ribbon topoisomerase 1